MFILLFLLPEVGRAMPHLKKERTTASLNRREVSCHACPTHLVNKARQSSAVSFPLMNNSWFPIICSVASLSTDFLNSELNATSKGCTFPVVPGRTKANVVLHSCCRILFTFPVVLAKWASYTSNRDRSWPNTFALFHIFLSQKIIISSSHDAFSRNLTMTCESYCLVSFPDVLFPWPLKINSDFSRGSPSANRVSCTVHCLLSRPKLLVLVQTDYSPMTFHQLTFTA